MITRRVLAALALMSLLALSLALAACGSAPERQWPIWTGGGGAYDDPSMYRGGGR